MAPRRAETFWSFPRWGRCRGSCCPRRCTCWVGTASAPRGPWGKHAPRCGRSSHTVFRDGWTTARAHQGRGSGPAHVRTSLCSCRAFRPIRSKYSRRFRSAFPFICDDPAASGPSTLPRLRAVRTPSRVRRLHSCHSLPWITLRLLSRESSVHSRRDSFAAHVAGEYSLSLCALSVHPLKSIFCRAEVLNSDDVNTEFFPTIIIFCHRSCF